MRGLKGLGMSIGNPVCPRTGTGTSRCFCRRIRGWISYSDHLWEVTPTISGKKNDALPSDMPQYSVCGANMAWHPKFNTA